MVLDATKVVLGQPLPERDVLWIAEQVPGLVATMDATPVLKRLGFWCVKVHGSRCLCLRR